MKKKFEPWLIAFEISLFCLFYGMANYKESYPPPEYLQDKIWYDGEAILIFCFNYWGLVSSKNINYRITWKILALFFLIRAIWEVSAMIQGVEIWEKIVMAAMYGATIIIIIIITLLPYIRMLLRYIRIYTRKIWQKLWH